MPLTKRNLPHLHYDHGTYFVTFRLAGTLPDNLRLKNTKSTKTKFADIDSILDSADYGMQYLKDYRIADIVKKNLHKFDSLEFKLICYTIMSNHVHLIFDLLENNRGISKIMQSIKGVSALESNKVLERTGQFWQDESYDRLIRNEKEFTAVLRYVMMNPVKAGLVDDWKDWSNSYCCDEFYELVSELCTG